MSQELFARLPGGAPLGYVMLGRKAVRKIPLDPVPLGTMSIGNRSILTTLQAVDHGMNFYVILWISMLRDGLLCISYRFPCSGMDFYAFPIDFHASGWISTLFL